MAFSAGVHDVDGSRNRLWDASHPHGPHGAVEVQSFSSDGSELQDNGVKLKRPESSGDAPVLQPTIMAAGSGTDCTT